MQKLCAELEAIWHRDIPISAQMGVRIEDFSDDVLTVTAGLEPNVNLHGTAFAGSLYSVCALTGWGMAWLQLKLRGLDAHIVLAEGQIEYRRAVAEDFTSRCRFDAASQADRISRLAHAAKSELRLESTIAVGERIAVRFGGRYSLRAVR